MPLTEIFDVATRYPHVLLTTYDRELMPGK